VKVCKLTDVLHALESGARPKGGVSFESGEIPSIGGEHLDSNGGFKLDNLKRVPEVFFESMRSGRIDSRNILVVKDGATTGKTSFVGRDFPFKKAAVNEHVFCLKVNETKAFPEYVFHFLRSDIGQASIMMDFRGATVGGISRQFSDKTQLPLPPLSEQKRIAEILDCAEALRSKRRAALALLDELTQSIFLDMFGDPVSNPKGWDDSRTLADVASIGSGITKGRRTSEPVRAVPYLAVVNVQDKMLDLSVVKTIEATEKEIDRYRLEKNDLVLTEGGDADKLGRGTLWNEEIPDCIHQNHIFRVRLETSDVTPVFLNWLVGGRRGKSYFLSRAKQTTGIATINMTQLKAFPMLIPPIELQDEFVRRISFIEVIRSNELNSLNELDALFTSLQHRAFRGEL
jgi:type I restriction enzyme S subunit